MLVEGLTMAALVDPAGAGSAAPLTEGEANTELLELVWEVATPLEPTGPMPMPLAAPSPALLHSLLLRPKVAGSGVDSSSA